MEYTIVDGFKLEEVIAAINERLKEGWDLHGSLAVTALVNPPEGLNACLYAQAMTKKAPEQWSAA
ncbi:MAG TPA: hypothetical protein VF553_05880 [Pyrinomonadaceae bacterium]|jgi:hypothetical protein